MAAPTSLLELLESLSQSLASAQEITPKIAEAKYQPDGISLLDVKNELLLSYLQNLVFLVLLKLRNAKQNSGSVHKENGKVDDAVRSKLVELRLYLERGARPLEEKLRFSIERFLRTAEDAQRQQTTKSRVSKHRRGGDSDGESSGSESSRSNGSDESGEDNEHTTRLKPNRSAAPNLGRMVADVTARRTENDAPSGVYRPPKREKQLMDSPSTRGRGDNSQRRPGRSSTMEEFVNSEFSTAPLAEPSIGTTIIQGGRKTRTAAQRKTEDERREYEEMNFVRLPTESKKEKAKRSKQEGRKSQMMFGGEEFHDLGEGVERIDRLTRKKEGGGGGVRAMLEKSRKRMAEPTVDGPRGSGHRWQPGDKLHKRAKTFEGGQRR